MMKKMPEAITDYKHSLMLDTGYALPRNALKRLHINYAN